MLVFKVIVFSVNRTRIIKGKVQESRILQYSLRHICYVLRTTSLSSVYSLLTVYVQFYMTYLMSVSVDRDPLL